LGNSPPREPDAKDSSNAANKTPEKAELAQLLSVLWRNSRPSELRNYLPISGALPSK
jgi:hypothetical protein